MRDYLSLMRMDCKAHKHTRTRLSPSSSIPECPQPAVLRTSPTAPCPGAPWRGGAALELDDTTHYDVGRYVTQARRQRALWGRPVRRRVPTRAKAGPADIGAAYGSLGLPILPHRAPTPYLPDRNQESHTSRLSVPSDTIQRNGNRRRTRAGSRGFLVGDIASARGKRSGSVWRPAWRPVPFPIGP